jgi:hypothetical protein
VTDEAELVVLDRVRDLQNRYAWALDDRDPAALRRLFHPDAVLRIFPPGADEPSLESAGHDQLDLMVEVMKQRYERTLHVLSNPSATLDGDTAEGQIYCVAHHLIGEDGGGIRKVAVYLTYRDGFRRDPVEGWKFSARNIHFLWVEECPVPAWEAGAAMARLV